MFFTVLVLIGSSLGAISVWRSIGFGDQERIKIAPIGLDIL
jgi:hypothetical protein